MQRKSIFVTENYPQKRFFWETKCITNIPPLLDQTAGRLHHKWTI